MYLSFNLDWRNKILDLMGHPKSGHVWSSPTLLFCTGKVFIIKKKLIQDENRRHLASHMVGRIRGFRCPLLVAKHFS